jgi:hypothetical protein
MGACSTDWRVAKCQKGGMKETPEQRKKKLNAERQRGYRDNMLKLKLKKQCLWVYDGDPSAEGDNVTPQETPPT